MLVPRALPSVRLLIAMALPALLAASGPAPTAFAQDEIGVFWDENFSETRATIETPFSQLTGHLVLGDLSVGGGVLAWECEVEVDGPATVLSWQLAGQTINARTPPRFSVGLASPLPPAVMTEVATFVLFVTAIEPVAVSLKPLYTASLPGAMAYIGGDSPALLTALNPHGGQSVVATVNAEVPVVAIDPLSIQFGTPRINESVESVIQVANLGGGQLALAVGLDCTGPGYSLLVGGGTTVLAGGESHLIRVRFTATRVEASECSVVLGPGLASVPMIGRGREPVVSWSEPADLDFGQRVTGSYTEKTTSLKNTGEVTLNVNVGWSEPCSGFSIVSGGGSYSVPPGNWANVRVGFAPGTAGGHACRLGFGPGLPEVTVAGTATLAARAYQVDPAAVVFPPTDVGQTRLRIVRLSNVGAAAFDFTPRVADPDSIYALNGSGQTVTLAPGETGDILVAFTPRAEVYYTGSLTLEDWMYPVPLSGVGGQGTAECAVSVDTLQFLVRQPGDTQSRSFTVSNPGTVPLDVAPWVDSPAFTVVPGPQTLGPGQSADFHVQFVAEAYGSVPATLELGPDGCRSISLLGRTEIEMLPGENLVGFFFDPAFTAIETGVATTNAVVPVYLALVNASPAAGIAAWECRAVATGNSVLDLRVLASNAVNAAAPDDVDEYTVGIGLEPLPYAAQGVLLATFNLLVFDDEPDNVTLELHPNRTPSLPGAMAWVPWDDPGRLIPMQTVTGVPTVARINSTGLVGLELPTPRGNWQGQEVVLEWPARATAATDYHVYRREAAGRETRLTTAPLPGTAPIIRYRDRPAFPAGTVLHYSYSLVTGGRETLRSESVAMILTDLPSAPARLLANIPNPFNPRTRIRFRLDRAGPTRVTIHDVTGRLVRTLVDGLRAAGGHEVPWHGVDDTGRPVASGSYYVRLVTEDRVDTRKIMMLK